MLLSLDWETRKIELLLGWPLNRLETFRSKYFENITNDSRKIPEIASYAFKGNNI